MTDTFQCPACGSEIATDGRALHKRSPKLEDLEKTAALVPKLEQAVKELEAESEQPRAQPQVRSPFRSPSRAPARPSPCKTKPARRLPPAKTIQKGEMRNVVSQETATAADPDDEFLR